MISNLAVSYGDDLQHWKIQKYIDKFMIVSVNTVTERLIVTAVIKEIA